MKSQKVDAHIHLFARGFRHDRAEHADLEEYAQLRRDFGIDRTLVIGYEGESAFGHNNQDVLTYAAQHEWLSPLLFVQPDATHAEDIRDRGALGVALYPTGPISTSLWDDIECQQLLVSINVGARNLANAIKDIRPENSRVLLSHLGLPGVLQPGRTVEEVRDVLRDVLDAAANPAMFVKVSAMYAIDPEPPFQAARTVFELLLEAYGADRLVWGSDYSPALEVVTPEHAFTLPAWIHQSVSDSDLAGIEGANMLRVMEELRAL